ncbi:MAG TPA: adenylate/guanylate cyclase domain-containing protein [Candidatus Binatia bacterium]|nr:adenylate/guanylate cyclase domain-containing protein [Candidatus Binatia bacterium]
MAEFLTGERPPVAIDRILTTVLFTDIVGSTERAAAVGDQQWRGLLDAHDRVVRTQLGHFRGQEISTTGDGFMARFDGHTGECEVRSGGVSGLAVHIAARVSALAGPGEVLVSRTVADLVSGSGIAFDDRGEHALKGVPGSWRPFAVRAVVAPLRRRAVGSRAP